MTFALGLCTGLFLGAVLTCATLYGFSTWLARD